MRRCKPPMRLDPPTSLAPVEGTSDSAAPESRRSPFRFHPERYTTMRRWTEQRWALDNIIRANGLDWDQPRLGNLAASLGAEASADIAAINARVKKFADIAPAFE